MLKNVCIQGLGFVGAAMAVAVASARSIDGEALYSVVGVDQDTPEGCERVRKLGKGEFPFPTLDNRLLEKVKECYSCGNLTTTTDESAYGDADVIVVDIPLDVSYTSDPPYFDLTEFSNAFRSLAKRAKDGALILIESTVPPGTCDKVLSPILDQELRLREIPPHSVHLAHSFERVMPGENYLASITNFWRVYSANSETSAQICEEFLSSIINVDDFPLMRLSSMTASETAKVMENSYRAANIAFMDEWTKFSEAVGIDLFEITEAIRVRPTHSNIRFPGLGVGGYCLTKDPAFTPAAASQIFNLTKLEFPFVKLLSRVNRSMPQHSVLRLKNMLNGSCDGKNILLCGVSYRGDVGDTRFSPVEIFARAIKHEGGCIQGFDPFVNEWIETGESMLSELPSAMLYDAIVFTTPHSEFKKINLVKWLGEARPVVLDTVNVVSKAHRSECRDAGIVIESIGRADGL